MRYPRRRRLQCVIGAVCTGGGVCGMAVSAAWRCLRHGSDGASQRVQRVDIGRSLGYDVSHGLKRSNVCIVRRVACVTASSEYMYHGKCDAEGTRQNSAIPFLVERNSIPVKRLF